MIDTPTGDPIAFAVVFKCSLCGVQFQRGLVEAEEGLAHLRYLDNDPDESFPSTAVARTAVHHCSEVLRGIAHVVGLAEVAARPALAVVGGGPNTVGDGDGISSAETPLEAAR